MGNMPVASGSKLPVLLFALNRRIASHSRSSNGFVEQEYAVDVECVFSYFFFFILSWIALMLCVPHASFYRALQPGNVAILLYADLGEGKFCRKNFPGLLPSHSSI